MLMDGQYSNISFVATKTDNIKARPTRAAAAHTFACPWPESGSLLTPLKA
jgi:hypothetical protein